MRPSSACCISTRGSTGETGSSPPIGWRIRFGRTRRMPSPRWAAEGSAAISVTSGTGISGGPPGWAIIGLTLPGGMAGSWWCCSMRWIWWLSRRLIPFLVGAQRRVMEAREGDHRSGGPVHRFAAVGAGELVFERNRPSWRSEFEGAMPWEQTGRGRSSWRGALGSPCVGVWLRPPRLTGSAEGSERRPRVSVSTHSGSDQ
jgi:hypothetical protein